jgi:hypothetical protein
MPPKYTNDFLNKMKIVFRCRKSKGRYYDAWKRPKPITAAQIAAAFAVAKARLRRWFSDAHALAGS